MVTEYFFDDIIIGLKKGLVTNMFFFLTLKNDNSARLTIFLIDKYLHASCNFDAFICEEIDDYDLYSICA